MDCSLPGSFVHVILQARILQWVATPSSRGSSRPWDQIWVFCVSCVRRQILYHWATKEALESHYFFTKASISHTHRIFCEHWNADDHRECISHLLLPLSPHPPSLLFIYFGFAHQALFFCWLEYIHMQAIMTVLKIQSFFLSRQVLHVQAVILFTLMGFLS